MFYFVTAWINAVLVYNVIQNRTHRAYYRMHLDNLLIRVISISKGANRFTLPY